MPDLEPWLAGPWIVDGRSDPAAIRLGNYYRDDILWPIAVDIRWDQPLMGLFN